MSLIANNACIHALVDGKHDKSYLPDYWPWFLILITLNFQNNNFLNPNREVKLTVRLCSDEERDALEPLDVGGGDVARALVVPLPVRVQRVQLHAPPRVRHLEEALLQTPARSLARCEGGSVNGVKFHLGRGGRGRARIEGDEAGPAGGGRAPDFTATCASTFTPLTWTPSSLTSSWTR